jgi:predicted DCC family thiol-disulfide oxidoreductase YuxK
MGDTSGSPRDARALLLYDGECAFCRWSLRRVLAWDRGRHLRPVALQESRATELLAELDEDARMASWHLVEADGTRFSGGAAVAPLMRLLPGGAPLARTAETFPRAVDASYGLIARHRSVLSRLVRRMVRR